MLGGRPVGGECCMALAAAVESVFDGYKKWRIQRTAEVRHMRGRTKAPSLGRRPPPTEQEAATRCPEARVGWGGGGAG